MDNDLLDSATLFKTRHYAILNRLDILYLQHVCHYHSLTNANQTNILPISVYVKVPINVVPRSTMDTNGGT